MILEFYIGFCRKYTKNSFLSMKLTIANNIFQVSSRYIG